eukprot:625623-Rhodomonas_salina.1
MEGFKHCIFKSLNNRCKARLLGKPAAADLRQRYGFGWCGHMCSVWLKVVAPQLWWHMLHRGWAPLTNVHGAMEKLKAV